MLTEEETLISAAKVEEVLNRLNRYYALRAQTAIRIQSNGIDIERWKAKQEAIMKVAENLEMVLREWK